MKTATIILEKLRQEKIEKKVAKILEHYDSFVLVEATDEQIKSLKQEGFKVVVPDDPGSIKLGELEINTGWQRYDKKEKSCLTHLIPTPEI